MNDYTKGILTGASLILCFFMLVSAKSESENLGDIRVNSITVQNGEGEECFWVGSAPEGDGYLTTFNANGKMTSYLGAHKSGSGGLTTFNTNGKKTSHLGTNKNGGFLTTHNNQEVETGYFGTNKDNDGLIVLSDRYGDIGWTKYGKK